MLKLIHTADWHLGQVFYDYDRRREHRHFLTELLGYVKAENADVLLISGDVFDTSIPSAYAQEMYYGFLHKVTSENPELQVVIIAGNHDSAARLEAPEPLLNVLNITVRGSLKRTVGGDIDYRHHIVPLKKRGETVAWCLAVPYLRYGDYPQAASYAEGVEQLVSLMLKQVPDTSLPVVAMAHLQASGAEISRNDRSERLVIGGLEGISPQAFQAGIAYTALGHLHRAQRVAHQENIRYSGAPLPMSFAERFNKQSIVAVTLDNNDAAIRLLPLKPLCGLQSVNARSVEEIFAKIEELPDGDKRDADYLEIKVNIGEPQPSLRHRIEEALEEKAVRLASLVSYTSGSGGNSLDTMSYDEFLELSPFDVAEEIFRRNYGGEAMPQGMRQLLEEVINEIDTE